MIFVLAFRVTPKTPLLSDRAFEHDKETLRSMGVALITEPLDADYPEHGDGYRVPPEQYTLADPGLTREETDALALAASAVKLKSDAAFSALGKLGSEKRRPSDVAVNLNDDERLTQLFSARSERRTIAFSYRDKDRRVDPYRLSFRHGHWYINGFDHGYADVRTYRLDRIVGELQVGVVGSFPAPEPADQPWLQPWQMGDETPVTVKILLDQSQAQLAIEQIGSESVIDRRADGAVVIAITVTNTEGFRAFVLDFLDHAEILEPAEVRQSYIDYLKSLVPA